MSFSFFSIVFPLLSSVMLQVSQVDIMDQIGIFAL